MKPFDWSEAASVREAARASGEGAALKAGGIDLIDLVKEGIATPRRVVGLRAIPGLAGIAELPDGRLRIGAMATLAEVAAHPLVRSRYRALAEAVGGSASPQIRNMATIGGNVLQRPRCWYFRSLHHRCARKGGAECFAFAGENRYHALFGQDGCAMVHPSTPATALVAFGAAVETARGAGPGRAAPLEAFLVAPARDITREHDLQAGEMLVALVLPPSRGARSRHLRLGELRSFDWPIADVAVVLDMAPGGIFRAARVVLGAAAPVPHRARGAEAVLAGKHIDEAVAARAARAALEGARPLSANGYKVPVLETLVRRALLEAADGAS